MSLTVEQPSGDQPCECGNNDCKVCVKGYGAFSGSQIAIRVCAKIYQPPNEPSNPEAGPPSDAACVKPKADGSWCIGMVGGAACAAQSPYPDNDVWVWAEYRVNSSSSSSSSSSGGFIYDVVTEQFGGKQQSSVPPCC